MRNTAGAEMTTILRETITLDDPDQRKFPLGTQGRAAIYTYPDSPFIVLRKISLRGYTWYNWLYPFSG